MRKSLIYHLDDNIVISYSDNSVELSERTRKIIGEHWQKKIRENPHLFNGTVLSLGNLLISGDKVRLSFMKTDYAHYLASEAFLLPSPESCRSFYVSAVIETEDNYTAFARMGTNSFEPGRYQYIGGGLDMTHISGTGIDCRSCLANELKEELGIDPDDPYQTSSIRPLFFSFGREKYKLSAIYHVKLNMDSQTLTQRLFSHNKALLKENRTPEVHSFIFVRKTDFRDFFRTGQDRTVDENLYFSLDSYYSGKVERDYSLIT